MIDQQPGRRGEPVPRPVISKVIEDARAAVADLRDGATVMISGFGRAGQPVELIEAVLDQGATGLIVISNNAGSGDTGLAALLGARRVAKVVCSFPRQSDSWVFDGLYRAGEVELELVPQGTLAERIRAGGAGIGAFFTPTGVGTELAAGKEHRHFGDREYVLELPLTADVALISGLHADRLGNLVYRKTGRNFGPIMATAAAVTIAQVDSVVPAGSLDPEAIATPGIFVDRVVPVGERAWLSNGRFIGGTDAAGIPLGDGVAG
jgi:3-oxoadipate CoA-transferase alpha subunit